MRFPSAPPDIELFLRDRPFGQNLYFNNSPSSLVKVIVNVMTKKKIEKVPLNGLKPTVDVGEGVMPFETKEYDQAVRIVHLVRGNNNYTMGVVLTLIEAALGDTAQSKALKQAIKKEFFSMMDRSQNHIYVELDQQKSWNAQPEIHIEVRE